jgi:hypothetical protein
LQRCVAAPAFQGIPSLSVAAVSKRVLSSSSQEADQRGLVVGTTHLFWNPAMEYIKLQQVCDVQCDLRCEFADF